MGGREEGANKDPPQYSGSSPPHHPPRRPPSGDSGHLSPGRPHGGGWEEGGGPECPPQTPESTVLRLQHARLSEEEETGRQRRPPCHRMNQEGLMPEDKEGRRS